MWFSVVVRFLLVAAFAACASTPVRPVAPSAPAAPTTAATPGRPLARMRGATADDGRAVLGRSDGFTQRMSAADRSFRLKQPLPVTEAAMLSFAAAQVQGFTPAEVARLERIRGAI